MTKEKLDKRAIKEAYMILMNLDEEDLAKIPKKIINVFQKEQDQAYLVDVDDLLDGNMLDETKSILCYLYSAYLSTEEEKNVIRDYYISIQKKKSDAKIVTNYQYPITNVENAFSMSKTQSKEIEEEKIQPKDTLTLTKKEDNHFFISLWQKIKNIFSHRRKK